MFNRNASSSGSRVGSCGSDARTRNLAAAPANATASNKPGESHRIYWQQWISSSNSNGSPNHHGNVGNEPKSRRELITSSAGIRISPIGAQAADVTNLLRSTLKVDALAPPATAAFDRMHVRKTVKRDSLVLVGTVYSLPQDCVQFDNSLTSRPSHASTPASNTNSTLDLSSSFSKPDPFHIIKTCLPNDDPLDIRRRMQDRLTTLQSSVPLSRTMISPKLQWFFIPDEAASLIPNCVELDGYCTSLEDEEEDRKQSHNRRLGAVDNGQVGNGEISQHLHDGDGDDSEFEPENDPYESLHFKSLMSFDGHENDLTDRIQTPLASKVPTTTNIDHLMGLKFDWLQYRETRDASSAFADDVHTTCSASSSTRVRQQRQQNTCASLYYRYRRRIEDKRRLQLRRDELTTSKNQSMVGFLNKRSTNDPHVWRRVYCVLSDNHLWFVSRIYSADSSIQNLPTADDQGNPFSLSKHGRIRLTNALLLEPSPDYIPLFRTPFAFELVTGKGKSYVFRASSKRSQHRWIHALKSRITQSFENTFLDHAELIVADECLARNQRLSQFALHSFLHTLEAMVDCNKVDNFDTTRGHLGAVVRWGMQVAAFRECCWHLMSLLPAKNPVVVSQSNKNSRNATHNSGGSSSGGERTSPLANCLIQIAWSRASELLARASHIATQLQQQQRSSQQPSPTLQQQLSHSMESHCRHVDSLIHGRFRNGNRDQNVVPPLELFDALLEELQRLAARLVDVSGVLVQPQMQPTHRQES